MTCFGLELKISQFDVCLEDTILAGKAVILPLLCLWQPNEVVIFPQSL